MGSEVDAMVESTVGDVRERRAVRRAFHDARRMACALLEPHGLTPSRFEVLRALEDVRAYGPGELAKQMGMTPSAMSRLLQGLEKEGFIASERQPGDRRHVRVFVTAEGRERFRRARKRLESADMSAAGEALREAVDESRAEVAGPDPIPPAWESALLHWRFVEVV